ncbi:MAG TPA: VOC family protein [Anaerolineae bacterium]|nr:VOC family protein [Anaerolineae bacterium]
MGQALNHYYWDRLSAIPEAEQCGWVKDRFGVSWQQVPANMAELMQRNPGKVMPVLLKMKNLIIADLERAGQAGA